MVDWLQKRDSRFEVVMLTDGRDSRRMEAPLHESTILVQYLMD